MIPAPATNLSFSKSVLRSFFRILFTASFALKVNDQYLQIYNSDMVDIPGYSRNFLIGIFHPIFIF